MAQHFIIAIECIFMFYIIADLPHPCLRAIVHLILNVLPALAVDGLERVAIVTGNDLSSCISEGEPVFEGICFEDIAKMGLDGLINRHAQNWFFVIAHIPHLYRDEVSSHNAASALQEHHSAIFVDDIAKEVSLAAIITESHGV